MITEININRFRCYNSTTIAGFKRVNLIGGLNNSGKTVLLESILLNVAPTTQHLAFLKQLRGEEMDTKDLPEYAWDNFYLHQDKKQEIQIITTHETGRTIALSIACDEMADDFKNADDTDNDDNFQIIANDFLANEKILKSVLHLKSKIDDSEEATVLTAMAHQKGYNFKEVNIPFSITANFVPASSKRKAAILARDYGIAEKRNKEKAVLEALQIVDKNIETIKVSVVGGAHLEIKRKGEGFMPTALFGDAINKVLNIVLTLINNNGSILLIDEIENGIHHTVQEDFWTFIFQLVNSVAFDVQVFATTHSLEMMRAFANVANDNFTNDAAYFELYRRPKTGDIDYNKHDLTTLIFELSNQLPVRGE
jgi:AAA15 family ATPase/GTPase